MFQLPTLTPLRVERLKARVPLQILSSEAGIAMATLSLAERNEATLSQEQEKRRRAALKKLARTGAADPSRPGDDATV